MNQALAPAEGATTALSHVQIEAMLTAGGPLTPAESAAAASDVIRAEVRTLVVTGPNIQSLLSAVAVDVEVAPTIEIDSDELAEELQLALGRMSTVSAAIEKERKERGEPLREALQWLMDGYSPSRDMLDKLIADGKAKLVKWAAFQREQARIVAEAEAKKRREAAQAAAEAAAKVEAEALATAQAAAVKATELREAGSEQVADAMESQAMVAVDAARQSAAVAAIAVNTAPVRTTGRATGGVSGATTKWKGECTDKVKLIQHIGEQIKAGDLSLIHLVLIDARAVTTLASAQKENLKVPGLHAYPDDSVRLRKQAVATV